jgi:hypothetical protein
MKERIITNIRQPDLNCAANGQRVPMAPMSIASPEPDGTAPTLPVNTTQPSDSQSSANPPPPPQP